MGEDLVASHGQAGGTPEAHIAGNEEGGRGGRAALSEPAPWAGEFAALPRPSDERPARA